MLDRTKKTHLVERILGLRHKLKVNESGPTPQNHKEMASLMVNHWELEDEILAIEEFMTAQRQLLKKERIAQLEKDFLSSNPVPEKKSKKS